MKGGKVLALREGKGDEEIVDEFFVFCFGTREALFLFFLIPVSSTLLGWVSGTRLRLDWMVG